MVFASSIIHGSSFVRGLRDQKRGCCAIKLASPRSGFTLVEISIVMIVIGLLIGGTFGGMKLIENMQVNKTVQDLKAIESAALTFKDTYGRLPGDITNPAARLPNCTVAPCATTGNGNRRIEPSNMMTALTAANEKFTFWHHLQAADLVTMGYRNTTDMTFGEGQPDSSLGVGYRLTGYVGAAYWALNRAGHQIWMTNEPSAACCSTWYDNTLTCPVIRALDSKADDARPTTGKLVNVHCAVDHVDQASDWSSFTGDTAVIFFPKF